MDWSWLAPAAFGAVAGSFAGAATALGVSWLERRWREQDVKAAETRARTRDRLAEVRRYGAALEEFVGRGLVTFELMNSDPESVRTKSWHEYYQSRLLQKSRELHREHPSPNPIFVIGDDPEAFYPLVELQIRAWDLQARILQFLQGERGQDAPNATAGMAEAQELLNRLLRRLDELAERATIKKAPKAKAQAPEQLALEE